MSQPDELRRAADGLAVIGYHADAEVMVSAADRIERLEAQQAAVLGLHTPARTAWKHRGTVCDHCNVSAPCATVRALTEDTPAPNGTNYTGPHPSVECAWGPCSNRLRDSRASLQQWCSIEHRNLSLKDPLTDQALSIQQRSVPQVVEGT